MGRPLRKLHQIHFCLSCGMDACNIRTTPVPRTRRLPEPGRYRALCQKTIGWKRRIAL
jgi:hypothetical protein